MSRGGKGFLLGAGLTMLVYPALLQGRPFTLVELIVFALWLAAYLLTDLGCER